MWAVQHRRGRHDGRLHDLPELRRLEMRVNPQGFLRTTNLN